MVKRVCHAEIGVESSEWVWCGVLCGPCSFLFKFDVFPLPVVFCCAWNRRLGYELARGIAPSAGDGGMDYIGIVSLFLFLHQGNYFIIGLEKAEVG